MADIVSTYELKNRYDPNTQYFTDIQASNCKIITTSKVSHDGTFNHWKFVVEDTDGNRYTWLDFRCLEGASKADVKSAILNHLTNDTIKAKTQGAYDYDYKLTESAPSDRGEDEYVGE